jgi:hypothetical protein
MDNLQVYKTKESLETMKRLNISDVFNVPYSPQFNGIESYFSLVKCEYKKLLLQRVLKGAETETVALIKESIENVSNEKTKRCARNGFDCMMK